MVNTRTDAELAAAVQAAVTAMLPQIREQVREEYRNGASAQGGNPSTTGEGLQAKAKGGMHGFSLCHGQDFKEREYHSLRQRAGESSNEFMQRFIRIAGFLGQAAGTAEEQAKNFRWGSLHKSNPRPNNWCWDATRTGVSIPPTTRATTLFSQQNKGTVRVLYLTQSAPHVDEDTHEVSSCLQLHVLSAVKLVIFQRDCKKNTGASSSGYADKSQTHQAVFCCVGEEQEEEK
ncbi:hypothetical protein Tco_0436522 [Tanacetum coccineum]